VTNNVVNESEYLPNSNKVNCSNELYNNSIDNITLSEDNSRSRIAFKSTIDTFTLKVCVIIVAASINECVYNWIKESNSQDSFFSHHPFFYHLMFSILLLFILPLLRMILIRWLPDVSLTEDMVVVYNGESTFINNLFFLLIKSLLPI